MHCIDDKPNGIILSHNGDWSGEVRITWYDANGRLDPGPKLSFLRGCWCVGADLVAGLYTPVNKPSSEAPHEDPPVNVLTRGVALAVEGYLRFKLGRALDDLFIKRGPCGEGSATEMAPVTAPADERLVMKRLLTKLQAIRSEIFDLKKTYVGNVSLRCQSLNDQCDLLESILDLPLSFPRASQADR